MPLDPNISLQVAPPAQFNPLQAYQQALTIKSLMGQQQLQDAQIQRAQREEMDAQAMKGAFAVGQDGTIDRGATLRNLARINPAMSAKLSHEWATEDIAKKKADSEAKSAGYKQAHDAAGIIGSVVGSLPENPSVDDIARARSYLERTGLHDALPMPGPGDNLAQWRKTMQAQALTAQQQIQQEWERNKPQSDLGRLLWDDERYADRAKQGGVGVDNSTTTIGGRPQIKEGNALVAQSLDTVAGSPFAGAIALASGRDPNKPFMLQGGKVVANQPYQDYDLKARAAGAQKVDVSVGGPRVDLGKPAMGKVDDGLLDTSAALMRMDRIGKNYRPEWSEFKTQAGMKLSALGEKYLGIKMDPNKKESFQQYTNWRRNTLDNLNKGIKEATGSAMGAAEADRIIASMPSPDDSPTEFQQKLDDTVGQYRMAMARFTYIKRQGGNMSIEDIPLEKMPDIMRTRDAELEAISVRKYPDMDKEERDRLIKRQLAQEFGLAYK